MTNEAALYTLKVKTGVTSDELGILRGTVVKRSNILCLNQKSVPGAFSSIVYETHCLI